MGNLIGTEKKVHKNCPIPDPNRRKEIKAVYICAIVIWLILIYILSLYDTDLWGWLILLVPIIVFVVNYSNVDKCSTDIDPESRQDNFLSFAFLIVIIIINWDNTYDRNKFFPILALGLVLTMLSLIDIWVNTDMLSLSRHIRSVFQTFGLVLLTYALYIYYLDEKNYHNKKSIKNPETVGCIMECN